MIAPHGGTLINKVLPKFEKERILKQSNEFDKIQVDDETLKIIKSISFGVFSPLEGFMNENDYHYVLDTMYLEKDVPWPIPITLDVSDEEIKNIKPEDQIILTDEKDYP
ncbi:MAG: sulfate adenylyltransferase, partial [Promethearchaeota archaeon]